MDHRHKDRHGLTPRQAMAAEHYILHGSMSDAYRHAYSTANMQPATVNRRAIDLFDRPYVAARVQALREENDRLSQLTREEALAILARIARGEVARYLDERGRVDPRAVKAGGGPDVEAVEEYDGAESQTRKVRLRDPIRAIERLAHMCGWDKQGPLAAEGVTIILNIGEADDDDE